MATETDARAGRAHPEAELVAAAGGSDGTRVKLCVTNVYNSSSSEVVSLETTNTVGDLKKLIEAAFAGRPPTHQQRLIFRGKQCEDSQQLGHILRGFDLAVQHNMHLVVTQPAERISSGTPDRVLPAERHPPPQQQPPPPSVSSSSAVAPNAPEVATGQPERIDLSAKQMEHLQWQYQQAMRENQQALQQHQQNHRFLSSQSMVLTQQQQQQFQQPRQYHSEVATTAATRALGGNMPGPAAGGAVRDVTGAPPAQFIPAAGLGEDGEAGRGNLADPPRRALDVGREARGLVKKMFQCMVIFLVFGINAHGLMLVLLAVGGLVTFLFKTGFLKEVLGGRQAGGGLWKKLCSAATVIAQGGGVLMDTRFLMTSFFLSIFPEWKPVRSPEAIAAEAAAAAAQAAAEAHRVEAAAAEAARVEAAAAEAAQAAAMEPAQQEAANGEFLATAEVEDLEVE